jgi:nitrogen regulatory protein P-II 1
MQLYRLEVYLPKNEVMSISEGLKKMDVGGLTVIKKRGRGKHPPPEIHAGKGSMVFTPQFTEKYIVELIIDESRKKEAIEIIRKNSTKGKIFVSPITETVDIETGEIDGDYK